MGFLPVRVQQGALANFFNCVALESTTVISLSSILMTMAVVDMENDRFEWKEIWDASYLKAIVAFYNTDGGCMIIGRKDNGEFVGLKDPKGDAKKISDTISNKLHISPDVHIQDFGGKLCVVINVSAGSRMISLDGRFYKRVGNTNQEIKGEDLRKILMKEDGLDWMDRPCKVTKDELSKEAIAYFIKSGKLCGRISKSASKNDLEKIIMTYGLSNDGALTLTAGVLFYPEPSRLNEAAFLKIGYFDERKVLRREEHIKGPVIMIPDKALSVLYESYIQDTYIYGGGTARRRIVHLYPEDALRELIVNAMVHKDYSIQEPTTIRVYPDRISIFCFGGLPEGWKTDKLLGEHESIRRNRALANVFFAAGYVENWGQGIEKVMEACRENGNPDPIFEDTGDGLRVIIGINPASLTSVEQSVTFDVDEKSKAILTCIQENPSVTAKEMAKITGIPIATVKRRLKEMSDANILVRDGSTKSGRWLIKND